MVFLIKQSSLCKTFIIHVTMVLPLARLWIDHIGRGTQSTVITDTPQRHRLIDLTQVDPLSEILQWVFRHRCGQVASNMTSKSQST